MVIKLFQIQIQDTKSMSKKQDNNSKKNTQQREKKQKPVQEKPTEPIPKTPEKKVEITPQQQLFGNMSPFYLPPKISQSSTALPNAYKCISDEMRVIDTPCNPNYSLYRNGDNEIFNDYLRPITNKIQWDRTPNKSDENMSSEEVEFSNSEQSSIIPEQYSNKEQSSSQKFESQQNPEKSQTYSKPLTKAQRHFTKRPSYSKKHSEPFSIPEPNAQSKKVYCNCKKTKCLKLYCDCFRINQTCEGCNCVGCHNLEQYAEERSNAIMVLMDRNPDPFSQKINDDKHLKGCNCKKSFCLKKYCECFQAGLKCGENCKCDECKNGGGSEKRQRDRMEREEMLMLHEQPVEAL